MSAPPAGCTIFTILANLPHHPQLCSAPQPMTTGHQQQLYSSSQANDTRSSAPDLLFGTPHAFWHPICLFGTSHAFLAPHMPFWRPTYAFSAPHICLMAPHMPYGAPSALWRPICLMVPHLPFWHPSAFLATMRAPSAFWLCNFFEKTHDKMSGSQKGPWFSIPRVQFVDDIIIMCNNQSALPTASANFCSIFPTCQDEPQSKSSFCLGT